MSELRELYQEVILDHSKNPRNFRELTTANHKSEGYNPLCGDRLTVYLLIEGDVVKDISFQGSGCAISKASASMMTAQLKGKTKQEAQKIFENFHHMLAGLPAGKAGDQNKKFDKEILGKLAVFSGVSEFPVRVKCATLPWHTFRAGLEGSNQTISTESFSTEWTAG